MDSISHSLYKAIALTFDTAGVNPPAPLASNKAALKAYPDEAGNIYAWLLPKTAELLAFQMELLGAGHRVSPALYTDGADVILGPDSVRVIRKDWEVRLEQKRGNDGRAARWVVYENSAPKLTQYADANGNQHFLNKTTDKEAWIEVTGAGFWVGHFVDGQTTLSAFPFTTVADAMAEVERLLA